ncbi:MULTISPECIES: zinc-dependent alcohol dehydrogenase family protein [unclassified Tolypothrix]|uniref:zinc-dependent alcohol dehydrogenase family protein n=1 Tax=unclassified Tolypothrix TaxID=2649714 RepID=UPI0005EABC93|nr:MULTISPECIES: NAD(P)-dependent alcohol dehydrogenase [unclassified Tolypothrix]BAY91489.1 alcohol dehydrogenase [Microchaete diplosiphon NIES-3275]EKF05455.1 oxidoreductase, zinc-binding dehydrogenase family protein [Tolypothrix sp. PCC 7601]MBE9087966.1 NAD(P)-dependent alcohol dehydrogenase [Tolypothrix sp. LEGE 11397]UYD25523.1 NAD(P)-dependent alcohol dehydrogenase [Tolypothrix sp. PCC 7712]UYD32236.1 NAD(P)-dependent alcohol dehydrogenase [Tolypothrix sp. PCC 7601]
MKAYVLQSNAGIDALKLTDRPEPQPGAGQVLIKIKATALNYRDLLVAEGAYGAGVKYPLVPMSDGAGEVVAIGEGVTRVKVGDRVAGIFFQDWISGALTREKMKSDLGGGIDGMLSEYVVLHQDGLVILPNHISYAQGATLPCAAVTAWHALVTKGNITEGNTVLLLGTGGVSIFALQFAKIFGAKVILSSSSDHKLAQALVLGADQTINYKTTPDWEKQVYAITDRIGVDHVVEVGGAGTLPKSLQAVRVGGRVSLIGVLSGRGNEIDPMPILFKSITLQGIYVGSRKMFEAMNQVIQDSQLQPVIDRIFPFTQAKEAYRYVKSASHFGKVVIELD